MTATVESENGEVKEVQSMPLLVDRMDDAANLAYGKLPDVPQRASFNRVTPFLWFASLVS